MERLNHIIEVIRQSHHLPWVIAFFVGLMVMGKAESANADIIGDNVPTTLIEGMGR